MFEEHNIGFKRLVDKGDKSKSSHNKYCQVISHLKSFLHDKDFPVSTIDTEFLHDFHDYLITEKSISHNTTVRYISAFGKILRKAHRKGYLSQDPTHDYRHRRKKKDPVFLEKNELMKIVNAEIIVPHLERVRDYFVFACCTGLSYADISGFCTDQIVQVSGIPHIYKERKKTGVISKVPLNKLALSILEKYSQGEANKTDDLVFPIPSNQKTNKYLKDVALIAGIRKRLTFHVARHTFATTVALAEGVSLKRASTMLGHSSVRLTEHYARVMDEQIASEVERLDSVFSE